ncbi:MAG: hypothetical protein HEQ38_01830 [Gemmatimonas sp.]|nr:hypothetical protein [Gemmatimonas sp.]
MAPLGTAVLGLLLGVSTLSAQPVASVFVRPGERVRVITRTPTREGAPRMGPSRVGLLQQQSRDSLTIDFANGDRETLALDQLARLEVSDGRTSYLAHGMGYGFVAGALVGAAVGMSASDVGNDIIPPVAVVAVTGVVGGLAGTVVGGVLGALGQRERWTKVRAENPLRRVTVAPHLAPAGAAPTRSGVQAGVQLGMRF